MEDFIVEQEFNGQQDEKQNNYGKADDSH